MSRAIQPTTDEQKRIIQLSSTLAPIDVWDEDTTGINPSEFHLGIEDVWGYNRSYYVNSSWRDTKTSIIVQEVKEYYVLRYIYYDATMHSLYDWSDRTSEVMQRWVDKDGNITLLAKDMWHKKLTYFRPHSAMRLRDNASSEYDMSVDIISLSYPRQLRIKEERNSLLANIKCNEYSFTRKTTFMLSPIGEYLDKCHHKLYLSLLKHQQHRLTSIMEHHKQIITAIRGGFRFTYKNISMWLDYVHMLGVNMPNCANQVFYLAPKDLKHSHDWMTRVDIKRVEKEEEKKRMAHTQEFIKHHKYFFNILFGNENITLHSLDSIQEYTEEGKAMHHCVGLYYKHENSLILSARDNDGKRIATIEVNIPNGNIIQVRGICNGRVAEDAEIRKLINDNERIITERRVLRDNDKKKTKVA